MSVRLPISDEVIAATNDLAEIMKQNTDILYAQVWTAKDGWSVRLDLPNLAQALIDAGYRKATPLAPTPPGGES